MGRTLSQKIDEIKVAAERLQKECDNWQASHDILSARYTTQAAERDEALAEVERLRLERDQARRLLHYRDVCQAACAAGPWHDVDDPPKDTGEETEYLTECICDDWNPSTQKVEPHREITMDIGYDFEAGRWDVDSGVEILRWAEIREPKGESDD